MFQRTAFRMIAKLGPSGRAHWGVVGEFFGYFGQSQMALVGGASHVERCGLRAASQLELLIHMAEVVLTVLSLSPRAAAISLLVFPSATRAKTLCSWGVIG